MIPLTTAEPLKAIRPFIHSFTHSVVHRITTQPQHRGLVMAADANAANHGLPLNSTEVPVPVPVYTIIQADGLYPVSNVHSRAFFVSNGQIQDDTVEQQIFTTSPTHVYKLDYFQTGLFPSGTAVSKPWSTIPQQVRDRVDGIMVLKMAFTAQDLALFPRLKVYVDAGPVPLAA